MVQIVGDVFLGRGGGRHLSTAIPYERDREPLNAEHLGVLGEVDWPPKYEPLGVVVSADVPSASPVASATHTARQVRLRLGSMGSSRLSHVAKQQQDPQRQALAVA